MIINNRGLNGSITKDSQGYNVDVTCKGWGSLDLFEILERLNLINKLEKMAAGEKVIFRDNWVMR